MAQNDIEVEIKTKLTKKQFDNIKKTLQKNCKFIKSSHQIDDYYVPKHRNFLKLKYPYEWLSIRHRSDKTILNYKHWYPQGVKFTQYADEYETEVIDKKQIEKIFKVLDIKKMVTVDKIRLTYNFKNKFEVAMDEVKSLGYFMEIEALKNKKDLTETHQDLVEFAAVLGVKQLVKISGGYAAEMLRRRKKLIKNFD